jgi:hypothetical protein
MHLNNLITLTLRRSCQTSAESWGQAVWPQANFQVQTIWELSVSMHTIPQHTVRCEASLEDDTQQPLNAFCYSCSACFMSLSKIQKVDFCSCFSTFRKAWICDLDILCQGMQFGTFVAKQQNSHEYCKNCFPLDLRFIFHKECVSL